VSGAGERVFVALGANIGDPPGQILAAFARLDALGLGPVRRSSLWESTPAECPPGSPRFVNAVAEVFPAEADGPIDWLDRLQALEREFGRRPKTVLNEPRPLDLDLVAWGKRRIESERLILPHPRALERRFVLAPLAELAPGWVWPGTARSVGDLLAGAPADPGLRRIIPDGPSEAESTTFGARSCKT
jgi:2-amino-4-hydroxy-6-hydroxymethyldihydropteridine diphosphokinase